jgi:hypothetical protein
LQLHQRQFGMDALHHLGRWQHLVHAPAVGGAHVHVLDEAQHNARALEVARHRQDFVVVGAALDDHVDLDRAQARRLRRFNACQHIGHRKVHIVHAAKHRVVQPVQADRHALQACSLQGLRLARQQRAIGGEGDVQRRAVHRAQGGQLPDQHFDVFAQERLAAGQADLAARHARQTAGPPA